MPPTAPPRCAVQLAILLLLPPLSGGAAFAGDAVSPRFSEEVLKQANIYLSKGGQVPDGYIIDRSLLSYIHTLPQEFDTALAQLGADDRWLDIGAGRGQAVLDYYAPRYDAMHSSERGQRRKKAHAVAISIEDRRTETWRLNATQMESGQIRYLAGKRLREYSAVELGQFQLITDVTGGFSYTTDLSLFMEKALALLKPDGNFFTVLVDVKSENGETRPFFSTSSFLTELTDANGDAAPVCSWLKKISCVEVTCESKANWQPPIEGYRIRKICNEVAVPALLPVFYEAGTPPARKFQLRR